MSLPELLARFETNKSTYLTRVGQAQAVAGQVDRLATLVTSRTADAESYAQVAALFQTYSEAEHEALRGRIESLVTYGLQTVFGEDMRFKVTPGSERGQATMRFTVETADAGETEILDARGGGLAAIVGFILRLVVLVLHPDGKRRFLMLDETFGMVSEQYQEPLSRLLRTLVDDAGLQLVLVTHQPAIAAHADLVYELSHDGARTQVRRLEIGDV